MSLWNPVSHAHVEFVVDAMVDGNDEIDTNLSGSIAIMKKNMEGFRAAIRHALMYGSECRAMKKPLDCMLEADEMRMIS
ncbi:hypothetical protein OROGR_003568 [Orobanche gracilis]